MTENGTVSSLSGWSTSSPFWQNGHLKLQRGRKTVEASIPSQSSMVLGMNPFISSKGAPRSTDVQFLLDILGGSDPDHGAGLLAVLEDYHGRYRRYAETLGEPLVLVDVAAAYHGFVPDLRRHTLDHRVHHAAGTAPRSPEVDQRRLARLCDLRVKVLFSHLKHFCHRSPFDPPLHGLDEPLDI